MTEQSLVRYHSADGVATITMDDGKANVMSEAMQRALNEALDRAETAGAVVLLTGRARIFSGGYDMAMFNRSRGEIARIFKAGGELVLRLLSFPTPVVIACNGHAVAQGAFLLLAGDVRIGAAGAFKIGLNEVAIGLTIPHYGVEIARARLSAPWFNHATTTGTMYGPNDAARAGFLDRVVEAADVLTAARETADQLTKIDGAAHAGTKMRVRHPALIAMREGIVTEFAAG